MSYEEAEPGRTRAEDEFSTANYRFRYVPGVVGESKRVVHQAVFTDGASVWSLCRQEFAVADVEQVGRCGMPCMACTAHAAVAATNRFPAIEGSPCVVEGSEVR